MKKDIPPVYPVTHSPVRINTKPVQSGLGIRTFYSIIHFLNSVVYSNIDLLDSIAYHARVKINPHPLCYKGKQNLFAVNDRHKANFTMQLIPMYCFFFDILTQTQIQAKKSLVTRLPSAETLLYRRAVYCMAQQMT